ncbi:MAG TPA: ATP synthase subunit I [Stellaceae bacterium]|nr:ATP synthase subunit I [Stellaceae bacterium]
MTHDTVVVSALAASMAVVGAIVGFVYFACLRRTVALFAGGGGWAGPAALTLVRVGAAVVVLGFAARLGAVALLAAFLGLLVARTIAMRRAQRAF